MMTDDKERKRLLADECKNCEFKGYSPQVCRLHAKHCNHDGPREPRPLSPTVQIGAKALAGVGIGVATVVFGSAMVSLVGGAAVLHAMLFKLGVGAGAAGGGIGLYRGLTGKKGEETEGREKI